MGCCFSALLKKTKREGYKKNAKGKFVCRDEGAGPKFWFLADSLRQKKRSLGLTREQAVFQDDFYKLSVNLKKSGRLAVNLNRAREEMEGEVSITASLHIIDQNIELIHTVTKEGIAGGKGDMFPDHKNGVTVTFPISKIVDEIPAVTFFVLEADFVIGDHKMKNNLGFTEDDYEKFFAWRSDQSDW
jgi:hypothetical protein